jgi:glycosyltransferase involved in cell wall biosynthesis
MKPLNILLLASKFDPSGTSPYLTDELCEALLDMGHSVDVIYLDWGRTYQGPATTQRGRLRVHVIPPAGGENGIARKAMKWVASAFRVAYFYRKHYQLNAHDLLISFSPSILFSVALLLLRSNIKTRVLIQWDFFPFHQAQIGLVPFRWMTSGGAFIETVLMNSFTHIGCMSPQNVAYLQKHYRISNCIQTGVLPIWAKTRPKPDIEKLDARDEIGLPKDSFVAVFGGQITAGRGIEDIVEMAKLACERASRILFLVVGSGPRAAWLEAQVMQLDGHLMVLPAMPREAYLRLIATCDVGLVLTVPKVDVPSFPSKTLDYCCVGIPVAAAVEPTTDFGHFISDTGFGRYCEAGNASGLLDILENLSSDPALLASMGRAAREQYESYFNVDNIATSLTKMVQNG